MKSKEGKGKNMKKKTLKYQKKSFSVINQFLVGVQNFPFFDNLAKKRAPPKHYKNMGFSKAFFEKEIWDKKQIRKFQLSFFAYFFSFNTYFIVF